MARQTGIIKINGTIGDLTLYKTQDGHLAKQKTSIDGSRIKSDPKFARTRENGQEFGESAGSSKLLRDCLRMMILGTADNRASSRMTQVMSVIKNLDTTSKRGLRNVASGITSTLGKQALKNFNFNQNSSLGAVLKKAFHVDSVTGDITIKNLITKNDVISPQGSTHVAFKGCWARVDFATGDTEVYETNEQSVALDMTSNNVLLSPTNSANGTGTDIFLLKLMFYQQINGDQYSLSNGAFNVLTIVEVL